MENDFYPLRSVSLRGYERKTQIMKDHELPIVRQCRVLEIARSGVYRRPVQDTESKQDLKRLIKEIHSKHRDLGIRRMCDALGNRSYWVGQCAVRTLI
jgi:putative transposase